MIKANIFTELRIERERQDQLWGEQNWPDGTVDSEYTRKVASAAKALCSAQHANGSLTWKDILNEEVKEAFTETDPPTTRGSTWWGSSGARPERYFDSRPG